MAETKAAKRERALRAKKQKLRIFPKIGAAINAVWGFGFRLVEEL